MKDHDNCKGCPTYITSTDRTIKCTLSFFNDSAECPCTFCLIKVMCEEACHDMEAFSVNIKVSHRKKYGALWKGERKSVKV